MENLKKMGPRYEIWVKYNTLVKKYYLKYYKNKNKINIICKK